MEETKLRLTVGLKQGKSVVTDRFFTSPLKLGLPEGTGERKVIMLMMASAGVLKGDAFSYDIRCESGTKTLLTEQSYTKIFDTGDGGAKRRQHITVDRGASLYYRPCAVIPFQNSTYDGDILVELDPESEFAWADIMTAGRVGMGEKFAFRHYRNRICVEAGGMPVWMDHCLFEPQTMDVEGMLFFDGYTHQGTFYYYGAKEKQEQIFAWQEQILEKEAEETKEAMQGIAFGVTEASAGVCVRVLARTAQDIEELFAELAGILELEQ